MTTSRLAIPPELRFEWRTKVVAARASKAKGAVEDDADSSAVGVFSDKAVRLGYEDK